jgi:hypothetical protein
MLCDTRAQIRNDGNFILLDCKQTYGCPDGKLGNSREGAGVQDTPGNQVTHSASASSTNSQVLHQAKTHVWRAAPLAMGGLKNVRPYCSPDLGGETPGYPYTRPPAGEEF